MTAILLATGNPAKLARLRWLLEGLDLVAYSPADVVQDSVPEIAEDGPDFAANAAQKARGWSRAVQGMLTLASDGGLRIPVLGERWDALRTRRNAGPDATDAERIAHLLGLMDGIQGDERRSVWHESLALAQDGLLLRSWNAEGDGGLIVGREGAGPAGDGFWTESVRYYPRAGKLYRDLDTAEIEALDLVWPRLRTEVWAYFSAGPK